MNYWEEFDTLQKNIPYYYKFSMFLVLHWIRMFFVLCHKTCIKPIEHHFSPENKKEPMEDRWVQIYTMTKDSDTSQFGTTEECFRSFEKYNFPYATDFFIFVENEFQFFTENPIQLKENTQFFKIHEIKETLFIVRTQNQYIVKSFPVLHRPIAQVLALPKISEISFSFIEYYHPKMVKPLEIVLPRDFYTIGNELFTCAFVLRQLELMNCFFIFDNDYEIHFIDHEIIERHLKFNESIEIEENTYKTNKKNAEEMIVEHLEDLSESNQWWKFY
jgi:hypothetical protein